MFALGNIVLERFVAIDIGFVLVSINLVSPSGIYRLSLSCRMTSAIKYSQAAQENLS